LRRHEPRLYRLQRRYEPTVLQTRSGGAEERAAEDQRTLPALATAAGAAE
jgi:hypothetical protein